MVELTGHCYTFEAQGVPGAFIGCKVGNQENFYYLVSSGDPHGVLFPRIPQYRRMTGCRGVCVDCKLWILDHPRPQAVDEALASHRGKSHDTAIIPDQVGMTVLVRPGLQVAECRRWPKEENPSA